MLQIAPRESAFSRPNHFSLSLSKSQNIPVIKNVLPFDKSLNNSFVLLSKGFSF